MFVVTILACVFFPNMDGPQFCGEQRDVAKSPQFKSERDCMRYARREYDDANFDIDPNAGLAKYRDVVFRITCHART